MHGAPRRINIRRPGQTGHLARPGKVVLSRRANFESRNRSKNVTPRAQVGYARAKFPPHCSTILALSIFADWGVTKANTRRGVFRVKIFEPSSLRRATMTRAQVSGEWPEGSHQKAGLRTVCAH